MHALARPHRVRLRLRLMAALLVLPLALLLDLWQRPLRPPPALARFAAVPAAPQAANLQAQASGNIPMPPAAATAHASNLLAMPDGDPAVLSAFWFAGDRESAPNVQIAASQFDRSRKQWLPARFVVNRHVMADQLGFGVRRLGNPVAWLDARGRMHLFVVATGWGGWAAARILHLEQDGPSHRLADLSFKPVRVLPLSWLWNTSFLVRNAPLHLEDGGMLLPAHFEIGIKYPIALRFDGRGEFMGMVRLSQQHHWLQPTLLALGPSHWLALLRDNRSGGHIGVVSSEDGGRHWQDQSDLALTNPDAAVAALALAPGQLVLAHNSAPASRELLDFSVSGDGQQWQRTLALARGPAGDEYSYPSMAWADGALWLSYTDRRHSIAWQRLAAPGAAAKARP